MLIRIDADAADARVTFRRRVAAAPTKMEIATTDIVEMVEVAAPGHKTVRYWLTIDRPTNLIAKLPLGAGLVEATEEQTLVALGELAEAPVTLVAAAPVPVIVAEPLLGAAPAQPAVAVALPAVVTPGTKVVPQQANGSATPVVTTKTAKTVAAMGLPPVRKIGRGAADDSALAVGATAQPAPLEVEVFNAQPNTPNDLPSGSAAVYCGGRNPGGC